MPANEMQEIQVQKVTVNISAGEVGSEVEKSVNLLKKLTGKNPVKTESSPDSKSFGVRSGLDIGAMVTLRGEEARDFLEKVMPAADDINKDAFDGNGNFSFGVSEYIDVPGVDYDSDIGMKGFEVAVTLERPGYRVKRRDYKSTQVGKDHKVTDSDAKQFVEDELGIEVTE
jgi:large subunit ribosomal protein L5